MVLTELFVFLISESSLLKYKDFLTNYIMNICYPSFENNDQVSLSYTHITVI